MIIKQSKMSPEHMSDKEEIWKPIKSTLFHEVSNHGRVRSIDHVTVTNHPNCGVFSQRRNGKIIKPVIVLGYPKVSITFNGFRKLVSVHRLVATEFLENPHNKPEINHISGVKTDNHISNLEWSTSSENQIHAFKTGLQKTRVGNKNKLTRLPDIYIPILKECRQRGFKGYDIAKYFGMSISHINGIIAGTKRMYS